MPYLENIEIFKLHKQHEECPTVTLKQLIDGAEIDLHIESFDELEKLVLQMKDFSVPFSRFMSDMHFDNLDDSPSMLETYQREYLGSFHRTRNDDHVDAMRYSLSSTTSGTEVPIFLWDEAVNTGTITPTMYTLPSNAVYLPDIEPRRPHRYGIFLQDIAFYYELWKQRGLLGFKHIFFKIFKFFICKIANRSRDPTKKPNNLTTSI